MDFIFALCFRKYFSHFQLFPLSDVLPFYANNNSTIESSSGNENKFIPHIFPNITR